MCVGGACVVHVCVCGRVCVGVWLWVGVLVRVSGCVCRSGVCMCACVAARVCWCGWLYLTRFNNIATERINSRWQVDKEALWLIESPTYLTKCTQPFLGTCQFYF